MANRKWWIDYWDEIDDVWINEYHGTHYGAVRKKGWEMEKLDYTIRLRDYKDDSVKDKDLSEEK